MKAKRAILRFKTTGESSLDIVYPVEIQRYESKFGPPKRWKAINWFAVALDLVTQIRIYKSNRNRLLKRLATQNVNTLDIEAKFAADQKKARVALARHAAHESHRASREKRAEALRFYESKSWHSALQAAVAIAPKVGYSVGTIQRWILQHKKSLHVPPSTDTKRRHAAA